MIKFNIKDIYKKMIILCLVVFVVFSSKLPGINLQLITLFPLRILIVFWMVYKLFKKNKINHIQKVTWLTLILLILFGCISFLWAVDISSSVTTVIVYITQFSTLLICFDIFKTKKDIEFGCKISTICMLGLCLLGIYESFSGRYLFSFSSNIDTYSRIYNTFGLIRPLTIYYNVNNFATYIVITLPISLWVLEKSKMSLLFKFVVYGSSLLTLLLIDSRAALLAAVIVLMFDLIYHLTPLSGVIYTIILLFVLNLLGSIISQASVWSIFNSNFREEPRILIWANSLKVLADHALMGVGIGNAVNANMQSVHFNALSVYNPHSLIIEILEEFGVFGITIVAIWISKVVRFFRLRIPKKSPAKFYLIVFGIAILIVNIVPSSMTGMYFLWLYFGMFLSFSYVTNTSDVRNIC